MGKERFLPRVEMTGGGLGGLKFDQLCFVAMLMSEEPEMFCVSLGYAVEGIW